MGTISIVNSLVDTKDAYGTVYAALITQQSGLIKRIYLPDIASGTVHVTTYDPQLARDATELSLGIRSGWIMSVKDTLSVAGQDCLGFNTEQEGVGFLTVRSKGVGNYLYLIFTGGSIAANVTTPVSITISSDYDD